MIGRRQQNVKLVWIFVLAQYCICREPQSIYRTLERSRVIADSWKVVIAETCGELVVGENP